MDPLEGNNSEEDEDELFSCLSLQQEKSEHLGTRDAFFQKRETPEKPNENVDEDGPRANFINLFESMEFQGLLADRELASSIVRRTSKRIYPSEVDRQLTKKMRDDRSMADFFRQTVDQIRERS